MFRRNHLEKFECLQKLKYKKRINEDDNSSVWKNECRKYLCLGRNAIAVILGTVLAYILNVNGIHPFTLTGKLNDMRVSSSILPNHIRVRDITGEVASGFPTVGLPPFETTIGNQTLNTVDMITHLGSSFIAIPLICILECIAVGKAFCKCQSFKHQTQSAYNLLSSSLFQPKEKLLTQRRKCWRLVCAIYLVHLFDPCQRLDRLHEQQ